MKYFPVSGNCSSDTRLSVRLVLVATQANHISRSHKLLSACLDEGQ